MTDLIDTHQHLVYPDVARYSWTDGIAALANRAFTLDDYRAATGGASIVGTLFMEAAVDDPDTEVETRHIAGLASDPDNDILGLIATARPEKDDGFADWLDTAKSLGSVGIRRVLHVVDDDLSKSETFRANVRRIGAAGMTFDMCFLSRQLPIARELAAACPETRMILNHCGVPDIAGGGLDPWRADMRTLAELENVTCKLSGLLAYCAPDNSDHAAIAPYVDHVLEVFGPSRMVWGSDWPVVDLGGGLPKWLDVTDRILADLSSDEADRIGSGTAREIYGV